MARATLIRPGLARWLLVLLAVPAIVAGILAMHFLAGLPAADQAHTASTIHAISEHDTVASMPDELCSADCMPAHEMAGMACLLLALLVAFVFLHSAGNSQGRLSPRAILTRVCTAASLAPPHPPSLIVLSISRT